MFGLGIPEIIIIALVILFLFGAKRIPDIGEGLGKTVKEIGKIKKDLSKERGPGKGQQAKNAEVQNDSLEDDGIGSKQDRVTEQVLDRMPGIKKARSIKQKADKIKKIVS
jgi:sec-independent protein translocase protein TatA